MSDPPSAELHEVIANDPELKELLEGMGQDDATVVGDAAAAAVGPEGTEPLPEIDPSSFEGEIAAMLAEAQTEQQAVVNELAALIGIATIKKGSRQAFAARMAKIHAGLLRLQARAESDGT